MATGIGTVEVRKRHGVMVVVALGRTPRGQKYIKKELKLKAKSSQDPKFKAELATAVAELYG